jgi:hypothetical protein
MGEPLAGRSEAKPQVFVAGQRLHFGGQLRDGFFDDQLVGLLFKVLGLGYVLHGGADKCFTEVFGELHFF